MEAELVDDAMEVEKVGSASQREGARQRQRRGRERARGLSAEAGTMERFLARAPPTPQQLEAESVAAACDAVHAAIAMQSKFTSERKLKRTLWQKL